MAEVGKIKGEKVYVCPQCGKEYPSSEKRCAHCGAALKLKVQNEHYYENDNAAESENTCYYLVDVITQEERYLIPEGRSLVGKIANSLIPITADFDVISGEHAEIMWGKGELPEIMDLNSSNGTFVNKRKLVPNTPVKLKLGDIICLGDTLQRGDMFRVKLMRLEAVEEE